MKKNYLQASFLSLLCLILFIRHSFSQVGEWTWMKGCNTTGCSAVWGTKGVSAPANTPDGTYAPYWWVDSAGNFWTYGGIGTSGYYSALWKYDPLLNQWTWVQGPNTGSQPPVWGTQGVFAANNSPGYRAFGSVCWTDNNFKFWLFGGDGSNGTMGDLWEYDPVINQWAWMAGSQSGGAAPIYGTKGVPAPGNNPGSRREGNATWVDNNGNLWMYGGATSTGNFKNDMWKFDVSVNQWAWMAGSTSNNKPGAYGIQGVADSLNTPGGRCSYCKWKDPSGRFWLFGGGNYNTAKYFNDLWMFDPSTNWWTWMSGTTLAGTDNNAGSKCDSSINYYPSARFEDRSCATDSCGNFWLFGGIHNTNTSQTANDLWIYRPDLNDWTYVSGDLTYNTTGVYGTQGTSNPNNKPGGRMGSIMWMDKNYNIWMYCGSMSWAVISFNDVWKFTPNPNCPAFQICNALSLPPSAAFTSNDSLFCANTCVDFFDFSLNNPTSWQWSFPGGSPSSSALQNPVNICYSTPGTYDVTLIVTNSFGSDTITLSSFITVNTAPTANISQSNDTLYSSAGNSYQWYTGGNAINGATNDFYVPSTEDFYSVVITDANGCTAADTIFFSLSPQTSFAASDTTICQKFCMDFFDQSGNNPSTWKWSFPGGVPSSSSQQNPTQICYNNPGVYDVTLITTNSFGSDTLVLAGYITVYSTPAFPTITVTGDILTSSYASSYQWQFNSVDIPGATNQSYTATETGYYTVIITDENGCVSSTTVFVEVTGVESIEDDFGFFVYPNPSNGNFTLEFSANISGVVLIEVIDMLGQKIFASEEKISSATKKEIQLTNISNGIYFIRFQIGNDFVSRKIQIID